MAEACINCGHKISGGGMLSLPNAAFRESTVRLVNFALGLQCEGLCEKCGTEHKTEAYAALRAEMDRLKQFMETATTQFPMMTVSVFPGVVDYRLLGLVTANVTVGTGLFNEFSQNLSDLFGRVNSQTGMAYKINTGESAARSILVTKAIQMGANCIIGVDIDYGVTTNNAATVNMQGTAAKVEDLTRILTPDRCRAANEMARVWKRMDDLHRWGQGDISPGEVFTTFEWTPN